MIYFVTENYLKTQTPITANIDVNNIVPFIKTQSDMRIMPILGTYFYNYILTAYNDQTLSVDEEELVTYIQPAIAWRSAEDAAFGLSYQLKNKGIQTQNGDYSNNVSQGEVNFVQDHYAQKASFYESRLWKYLDVNRELFANFISQLNKDSDIRPAVQQTQGFNDSILFL
tara:strand:+ start:29 stop:538 length:510 start_codon:yes stop_codon:yes gene_type:complete